MYTLPRCPNEHRKSELRNGPQLIRRSQGSLNLIQSLGADFPAIECVCFKSEKTTLALQFLLGGAEQGEKGAYITFSETDVELRQSAQSHGWSLDALSVIDLTKMNSELGIEKQYTVLHPADVELAETSTDFLKKIKVFKPRRLVLDSLSELRMVARDPLRYRSQILALKQALSVLGRTVLFLDDQTSETGADLLLQSIAHGVVQLTSDESSQGALHRRIRVTKMRGIPFIEGAHDFRIATGGDKSVFPVWLQQDRPFSMDSMLVRLLRAA